MFLGHFAVGLAGRRLTPQVSLAAWFASVQLVDLVWPVCLLLGLERVRIAPGITAFTPLDFEHYPITHSLVGVAVWAALFGGLWWAKHSRLPRFQLPDARRAAWLLAAGVASHWVLDVVAHRPDVPVLPGGPFLGLGLWQSVPATLLVELAMFAAGLYVFVRSGATAIRRPSFWLLIAMLLIAYVATAFGPPPPSVAAVAWTTMAMWLLIPWALWADRS
jgi:hypothetical protein